MYQSELTGLTEFRDGVLRRAVGDHDRREVQKALALCHTLGEMDDTMIFCPPVIFEVVAWVPDFQFKDKNYLHDELRNNYKIFLDFVEKFNQLEEAGKTNGLTLKDFLLRKDYREFNLLCAPVFTRNLGLVQLLLGFYLDVFGLEDLQQIVSEITSMELIGDEESQMLLDQMDFKWRGEMTVEMIPEPDAPAWKVQATQEEKAASNKKKKLKAKAGKAAKKEAKSSGF
jgi:hypothetical protein